MATANNVNTGIPITPPVRYSKQAMVIIFIFLAVIFFSAMLIIWLKSDKNSPEQKPLGQTEIIIPSMYTEYHTLKQGEVIRVKVPSGYSYTCSGGGKKYYHQAQNSQKEVWGDGTYHKAGEHVAYFNLSYYDEEIIVVCELKKL